MENFGRKGGGGGGGITAGKWQLWKHVKCVKNMRKQRRMKISHFVHTKKKKSWKNEKLL